MHSPGEPILLPEDLQVAARHGQYTPARACRADAWLRAHCAVSATPCQLDARPQTVLLLPTSPLMSVTISAGHTTRSVVQQERHQAATDFPQA